MAYLYNWNEEKYQHARKYPDSIDWEDFASGIRDFPDYASIANPYLIRDQEDHKFWHDFFTERFQKNCYFGFVTRIINSYMIAGEMKVNESRGMIGPKTF